MANRHANKRLRAACRERMAKTGETYQQARHRLLQKRPIGAVSQTDLQPVLYHGIPATLVTIEQHGAIVTLLMPSPTLWPRGYPTRWPASMLRSWMKPMGGLQ
jgi:hypothetical protein